MTTLEQLTSYCELALGQLIDDSEETRAALLFNVKGWVDRLLGQHIAKNDAIGQLRRSAAFVSTYLLPVTEDTTLPGDRMYFTLPASVYDLDLDGGINYICYSDEPDTGCPPGLYKLTFSRTTAAEVNGLRKMKEQAPSPFNPYFYRTTSRAEATAAPGRVYLPGVTTAVTRVEVGLFTTTDPLATINPYAPFEFPEELIPILVRYVVDQGRMSMMLPQERLRNDGRANDLGQPPPGATAQRTISYNDPLVSGAEQ